MSGVDDIRADLGAVGESFDEAEGLVTRASSVAGDLERSAADHGWDAVRQVMSECQEKLEEATPVIGDAQQAAVDGVATLTRITQEMSSDEVAAHLATVGERLSSAHTAAGHVLQSLGDARAGAEQAGATTVVELIDATETALSSGQGRLEAATTAIDAERSEAAAWGETGGGAASAPQPSPGTPSQNPGLTPERLLDDPQAGRGQHPVAVQQLLDEHLDPGRWIRASLKKGEGTRWYDGRGRSIAIERQPQVDDDLHRGWYLKVANNGRIERVPLAGNPVLGDERQT